MPRQPAFGVDVSLRPEYGPRPSVAGAAGALETVKKVLTGPGPVPVRLRL